MSNHIDAYDGMTVGEVKDAVREGDYSDSQLADIDAYERDHHDRVTLTRWLASRYDEPEGETEPDEVVVEAGEQIGHVAGLHFEYAFEHKTTEYNTRIKRAIERGDLRRIE